MEMELIHCLCFQNNWNLEVRTQLHGTEFKIQSYTRKINNWSVSK